MTGEKTDFTQGSILHKLCLFMLPVLGTLILQAAYGAVDLLVVGRFGSTSGLSAVSTGSQVLNLVTFVVTQLAMGVTLTASYVRICGGGTFFIVAYNLLSAIFRRLGDSRSPLLFVLVACLVNVAGDLLLVAGLGMDAAVVRSGSAYLKGFAPETIMTVVLFSMVGYFNGSGRRPVLCRDIVAYARRRPRPCARRRRPKRGFHTRGRGRRAPCRRRSTRCAARRDRRGSRG